MKIKLILYTLIVAILLYYVTVYFSTMKNHNGHFVIAHDETFHPLNLLGKEVGIEVFCDHLIEKIAKDQELDISIKTVSYDNLHLGLQTGLYDAILIPVLTEWTNIGQYYFSEPLFSLAPVLVLRTVDTEQTFADFKGKTIGIDRASPLMEQVRAIPSIRVAPYDKLYDALQNLLNDKIDALVMDALQAYVYTEGFFKGQLRIFQPALSTAGIKLVTLPTERGRIFLDSINKGLLNLINNGTYQTLLDDWDFDNYPLPPLQVTPPLLMD